MADLNLTGQSLDRADIVFIVANRITNNTIGIDLSTEQTITAWNFFDGNTDDLANPAAWAEEGAYACYICDESEINTNQTDDADPGAPLHGDGDDGYNAQATEDFNLKADRTYNGDGTDVVGLNIGS